MNGVYEAKLTRAVLTATMEQVPPHLRAILTVVRDDRIAFMTVPQAFGAFRIPGHADRPTIALIGDDLYQALGPDAFHTPSLRRLIRGCDFFAVVSSAADPDFYSGFAATVAVTRKSGLLVETRVEMEIPWTHLIRRYAPDKPVVLSTVGGGHA